jgi:hypothetical protein
MSDTAPTPITAYDHSFDLNALPAASIRALVSRGLSHVLGNEVASKVSGLKAKAEAAGEALSAEFIEAHSQAFRAEKIQQIMEGTLGTVRVSSGPRGDAIGTIARDLAIKECKAIFAQRGWKFPAKNDEEFTFPNGTTKTRAAMIETRLKAEGERLRAEATKIHQAEAKRLAKLAGIGDAEGAGGAEDLGL